jgi:hypothetical protein
VKKAKCAALLTLRPSMMIDKSLSAGDLERAAPYG